MAQIRTGTCSVTNGSANVIASAGNDWSLAAANCLFSIPALDGSSVLYTIATVVAPGVSASGNWEINLTAPYSGATATGAAYEITKDFTPGLQLSTLQRGDTDTAILINRNLQILEDFILNSEFEDGMTITTGVQGFSFDSTGDQLDAWGFGWAGDEPSLGVTNAAGNKVFNLFALGESALMGYGATNYIQFEANHTRLKSDHQVNISVGNTVIVEKNTASTSNLAEFNLYGGSTAFSIGYTGAVTATSTVDAGGFKVANVATLDPSVNGLRLWASVPNIWVGTSGSILFSSASTDGSTGPHDVTIKRGGAGTILIGNNAGGYGNLTCKDVSAWGNASVVGFLNVNGGGITLNGTSDSWLQVNSSDATKSSVLALQNGGAQKFLLYYDPNTNRTSLIPSGGSTVAVIHNGGIEPSAATHPTVRARRNASQTLSVGSETVLVFDTEIKDTANIYNPSTGETTIGTNAAGEYTVGVAGLYFSGGSSSDDVIVFVSVNGTQARHLFCRRSASQFAESGSAEIPLNAGDVVTVRAYQAAGTAWAVSSGAAASNHFFLSRKFTSQ